MDQVQEATVSINSLLLDPNNYRFLDREDFVRAAPERFHEESVQERAEQRLREDGLVELKGSILKNGLLPVERLIVKKYPGEPERYVVIEGNRRLAAMRWIVKDQLAGATVAESVMTSLQNVPVLVIETGTDDAVFCDALLGVRHVSGIKEWGGYQRAKLVSVLKDERGIDTAEIADRFGMKANEVNRRYRAIKALQQMQEHEDFGSFAKPEMYPLFHEAVSLPKVREWLGWSEESSTFTNEEQLQHLYELIIPTEIDDSKRDPKITTYLQVRELRDILPNAEAKRVLLDPARSFFDALSIAKREELSRSWGAQVQSAITALNAMEVGVLRSLNPTDLDLIRLLRDTANEAVESHRKLTS